jgi:hypothetical protein
MCNHTVTSPAIGLNPGGLEGRGPQILKWVRVRVKEGKEWEWEGKTPAQVSQQIDATVAS